MSEYRVDVTVRSPQGVVRSGAFTVSQTDPDVLRQMEFQFYHKIRAALAAMDKEACPCCNHIPCIQP